MKTKVLLNFWTIYILYLVLITINSLSHDHYFYIIFFAGAFQTLIPVTVQCFPPTPCTPSLLVPPPTKKWWADTVPCVTLQCLPFLDLVLEVPPHPICILNATTMEGIITIVILIPILLISLAHLLLCRVGALEDLLPTTTPIIRDTHLRGCKVVWANFLLATINQFIRGEWVDHCHHHLDQCTMKCQVSRRFSNLS